MAHEPYLKSQITIVRDDNHVYVDGVALAINMNELPGYIHAVQWDGKTQQGHIEFKSHAHGQRHPNVKITDLAPYFYLVDRWDIERDARERAAKAAMVDAEADAAKEQARVEAEAKAFQDRRRAEHESWKQHKGKLDPHVAAAIEAACIAHGGRLPE